ncbi:MAG: 2-oxo acid dehydrogenase subunit E2 [Sphingobacteriales bacterium]|jgi:2-oxoglutarate dehydrogenase E2 component (dihydrolipoamide succinyltransferase)|nr:2-oxo acid dehydrogenase subunit E2 [Sphingobacteriales bacterium]MBP9142765.1 2-oxo acid dehydrogenase subunit E2 [Chitinophagales bacterium]MDA0198518.1 dihydrolipoamide acetyltransferase family protein [Bacteroidota bacterium]MBK6889591.1 2-oxo acid dehydrogenase subunit E2 [Sphingobacteriales bacterium]MBK7527900.1 2-oxo acid dehydrogenase subunit E2 [Sphingobacteriales bacterium]
MAETPLVMPKMGESIMEATILKWLKKEGEMVAEEEAVLEIATDKVDSEVPCPVAGTIAKILYPEGAVVKVGEPIAYISSGSAGATTTENTSSRSGQSNNQVAAAQQPVVPAQQLPINSNNNEGAEQQANRFYSPLVRNIAKQENITIAELNNLSGTGKDNRVTKKDILSYIENRSTAPVQQQSATTTTTPAVSAKSTAPNLTPPKVDISGNVEIQEMDRMRRLIADHMVMSKHVAPHVTSFVEVDVTNLVNWRNAVKSKFEKREGEKITFTPVFIEACVKAIKDYPLINSSVDGYNIVVRKDINIGVAAALPTGNLIVPVIKAADRMNLLGLTKNLNDLANRARKNQLKPEEIQGGTFTLTNVGGFGSLMGTPIINQPQVAILATGSIRKKPAVLETEHGDVIAIRHMMMMSLSYDHRIVDGALGSSFLSKVAWYLENFDAKREI